MRTLINATFDPYLGSAMILPIGKDTDTVTARKNIVQVMFKLREGEVFPDHLCHLKSWLDRERDLCDHTKSSKSDHCACKFVS